MGVSVQLLKGTSVRIVAPPGFPLEQATLSIV